MTSKIILLTELAIISLLFIRIVRKPILGLYLSVFFFMFDSLYISTPIINLSLSNIFIVFTLIAVIMRWIYYKRINIKRIDKISLLLSGGLVFSAILSLNVAMYPVITLRLIITVIGGLLLLFCTQVLISHPFQIRNLLKVYIASATICGLLGIIQAFLAVYAGIEYGRITWALGTPTKGMTQLQIPRVTSTWNDPNIYGLFLIPGLIFVINIPKKKLMKYALSIVLLFGIALSYSRTAWISAFVAVNILLALYWIRGRKLKSVKKFEFVLRGSALLFMVLMITFIIPWADIWERLIELNPISFKDRIRMTYIGLEYFSKSPFFGIGLGNLLPISQAYTHNSYISVLVECGIIGGLCWLLLLFRTVKIGFKNFLKITNESLWHLTTSSLAALVGLLVGGLSIEIQNAKFMWLMIAIVIISGRQKIITKKTYLVLREA